MRVSNWLINATKKWVIDPTTNKWKIGSGGDPCCFRQVIGCDGVPTNFWMTSTNANIVPFFKFSGTCYQFGATAACPPPGSVMLSPAQVQPFASCAACNVPPTCPRCNMSQIRAFVVGMTGACCSPWNGVFDLNVTTPTSPDLCFFDTIVGAMPSGCAPVSAGKPVHMTAFTESNEHIGFFLASDGQNMYGGDAFGAVQSLCDGNPVTINITPKPHNFGGFICPGGAPGTVILSKII